jgi:hypothetical protein
VGIGQTTNVRSKGGYEIGQRVGRRCGGRYTVCLIPTARFCKDLKSYYDRKVSEGKNKMSFLNAVKNKIIHRIFACVSQNRMYQKAYSFSLVDHRNRKHAAQPAGQRACAIAYCFSKSGLFTMIISCLNENY